MSNNLRTMYFVPNPQLRPSPNARLEAAARNPATQSLLPLIEEIDSLPYHLQNTGGGDPAHNPVLGKRLIPIHATLADFRANIPPVGLVPTTLLNHLRKEKGLQFFSIIKRLEPEQGSKVGKKGKGNGNGKGKGTERGREGSQPRLQLQDDEIEIEGQVEGAGEGQARRLDDVDTDRKRKGAADAQLADSGQDHVQSDPQSQEPSAQAGTSTSAQGDSGESPASDQSTHLVHTSAAAPPPTTNREGLVAAQIEVEGKIKKPKGAYRLIVLCVFFSDEVNAKGTKARTEVMMSLANRWRAEGLFPDRTKMWNDERFPVYASPLSSAWSFGKDQNENDASAQGATPSHKGQDNSEIAGKGKNKEEGEREDNGSEDAPLALNAPFGNVLFEFQRCLTPVIGVASFGTHLTAYEGTGDDMKIWVSTRSAKGDAWPLKLDSTSAGGLTSGSTPLENVIKESEEEAGLPRSLVAKYVRCAGIVSYFQATKTGYLVPGSEYTYDLQLPPQDSEEYVQPKPDFEESEAFTLMTISEIMAALHAHRFKPLSALTTVHFLIRHRVVTPENEPNYFDIIRRCHRRSGLAGPGL